MKTFPAIVTGIFLVLAIGAVIIFATFSATNRNAIGTLVIWGTVPHEVFDTLLGDLGTGNNNYVGVSYQVVREEELIPQLVEAIAAGKGPDLVLFPGKNLLGQADKLQSISYSAMSRRDFENTFIQAGDSFLTAGGILGFPFTVDPLVMYWNQSLFANAGIAQAPRFWDEISDITPKLTKADKNGTLTESAVSFGTWKNVEHAKEILLSILYQLGNPVIASKDNGGYQSVFLNQSGGATLPADSTLRFYTDFANPSKPLYSWNSSESDSHDAFVGGELATYFGFASELIGIRAANPNLDFDVATVPAIRGGGQSAYANVMALSIPRGAKNPSGALIVAAALTSKSSEESLTGILHQPSVRRDVSPPSSADPYAVVFRNAALSAFTFLDPNPTATDSIFERMVENVSSGKLQVSEATINANQELQALVGVQ
ncbi:MAG: extracellular solute-binding protein [bacterium]|nr:extracellular solute-binding protein [bacterium]